MAAVPGDVKDCLGGKAAVARPPKSQGGSSEAALGLEMPPMPLTWNSHPQGRLDFQVKDEWGKGL